MLVASPVYVSAAFDYLIGRPLANAVTAKGKLTTGDTLATFRPHLFWLTAALGLLTSTQVFGLGTSYPTLTFWLLMTSTICGSPIVVHVIRLIRSRMVRVPSVNALLPVAAPAEWSSEAERDTIAA